MGVMPYDAAIANFLEIVLKAWDVIKDHPRAKLASKRIELESLSRQAQIDGDVDMLRRIRGEIDEIDIRLAVSDTKPSV